MAHSGSLHYKEREEKLQGRAYNKKNYLSSTENLVPLTLTRVGDGICIFCCMIKNPQATNKRRAEECPVNFCLSGPATAACFIPERQQQGVLSPSSSTDPPGHAVASCDTQPGIKARFVVFSPHLAEASGSSIRKVAVCNRENGEYSEICKEFNPLSSQNTKNSSFHKGTE